MKMHDHIDSIVVEHDARVNIPGSLVQRVAIFQDYFSVAIYFDQAGCGNFIETQTVLTDLFTSSNSIADSPAAVVTLLSAPAREWRGGGEKYCGDRTWL